MARYPWHMDWRFHSAPDPGSTDALNAASGRQRIVAWHALLAGDCVGPSYKRYTGFGVPSRATGNFDLRLYTYPGSASAVGLLGGITPQIGRFRQNP